MPRECYPRPSQATAPCCLQRRPSSAQIRHGPCPQLKEEQCSWHFCSGVWSTFSISKFKKVFNFSFHCSSLSAVLEIVWNMVSFTFRSQYPTLREAIQQNFTTLVYLSQLTDSNRVYGSEQQNKGKKLTGWSQNSKMPTLIHGERTTPPRPNLKISKMGNNVGIRSKQIGSGYTTLDSIPHIQKASGVRFFCPKLKGVDKQVLLCLYLRFSSSKMALLYPPASQSGSSRCIVGF